MTNTPGTELPARLDLPVLGMHCAACANRIEKALAAVPGVSSVGVNFATASATVQFDPTIANPDALREAVREQGYDLALPTPGDTHGQNPEDAAVASQAAEYQAMRTRFIIAAILTGPLLILAMAGHAIPSLRDAFDFAARPWVELAFTTPVLFWAGRDFFTGAWRAALHRAADMNTLIALGTLSAYGYSLVATVFPQWFSSTGRGHPEVYYEVAASIVTLILLGNMLQARATNRTRGAIKALIGLRRKLPTLNAMAASKTSRSITSKSATWCSFIPAKKCRWTASLKMANPMSMNRC